MIPPLPPSWRRPLAGETEKPYFHRLDQFLDQEQRAATIYPPRSEIFAALKLTPYQSVRVLLLGQDPYPGAGQAQGLCFSVRPGVKPPASLRSMFKELQSDVGFRIPNNGSLVTWAMQGILMLNAVLTVRAGEPNSHQGKGWENFTDTIISRVNEKVDPVVFVLWGAYAQKKSGLIDIGRHTVIKSAHPSPLSARHGFFGSRPFSKINQALRAAHQTPIDWEVPDI